MTLYLDKMLEYANLIQAFSTAYLVKINRSVSFDITDDDET